jgi:hypothetical protein
MCLNLLMAHEDIGQSFLLKLYEKSVSDSIQDFDMYEIGSDIGLLDKVQTDNLVEELLDRGYVNKAKEKSKIYLSNKGRKRVEI